MPAPNVVVVAILQYHPNHYKTNHCYINQPIGNPTPSPKFSSKTHFHFKVQTIHSLISFILQSSFHFFFFPMTLLLLSILLFLFFPILYAEDEQVIKALVTFMNKLQPPNSPTDPNWGWNLTSDPCTHQWHGVRCYSNSKFVRNIVLEDSGFTGVLDSASLCTLEFLQVLSLKNNNLHGLISEEIGACKSLSFFYLSTNNFSGDIPLSVSELVNLKRIDLSDNNFTGDLPDMSGVSGLLSFRAQNNNFTGEIPNFDFSNLQELNVSNNNLQGPIPDDVKGLFGADSFSGNPNLCGTPLPNVCPPSPPPLPKHHRKNRTLSHGFVVYSGYVILGVVLLLYLMFKVAMKLKGEKEKSSKKKEMGGEEGSSNYRDNKGRETTSNELSRMLGVGSEYSLTSGEKLGTSVSTSLMVLWSPMVRTLKFEDLLRAPAELIGRGKHGSTYKVMMENNNNNGGVVLAVKRIKDWGISKEDFERRMQKVDQAKHPSVNPLLAYYCSHQEKLLVYEYQHNGSLFKKLHGESLFEYRTSIVWSKLRFSPNTLIVPDFLTKLQTLTI